MIKRTLILAALVCAMAGEMYASNTETQVVNPQPESVRILQEQLLSQTVTSNFEVTIIISFTITVDGEIYRIEGVMHIGNERPHFVEVEVNVYDSNDNFLFQIKATYSEEGERTGLLLTNPSGEEITSTPYEIEVIMGELDNLVANALESI